MITLKIKQTEVRDKNNEKKNKLDIRGKIFQVKH